MSRNKVNECKIFVELIKFTIQFACFTFVAFQTSKCFDKFLNRPKNTEITIKHAHEFPYPDLTLCPYQADDSYKIRLAECNLTTYDYFGNDIWFSNVSDTICNDPELLYEHFTKDISSKINAVSLNGFNVEESPFISGVENEYWEAIGKLIKWSLGGKAS